jgi:hypothetical protein
VFPLKCSNCGQVLRIEDITGLYLEETACGSCGKLSGVLTRVAADGIALRGTYFFRLNFKLAQLEYYDREERKRWFGLNREPKVVWYLPAMSVVDMAGLAGPGGGGHGGGHGGGGAAGGGGDAAVARPEALSFTLRGLVEEVRLQAANMHERAQWLTSIRLAIAKHAEMMHHPPAAESRDL